MDEKDTTDIWVEFEQQAQTRYGKPRGTAVAFLAAAEAAILDLKDAEPGRDVSLALTKVQEALLWITAGGPLASD